MAKEISPCLECGLPHAPGDCDGRPTLCGYPDGVFTVEVGPNVSIGIPVRGTIEEKDEDAHGYGYGV